MKQSQLQELIRHITQRVLKELSAPVSTGGRDEAETNSANTDVPIDQLSAGEIAKMRREKDLQRRDQIKQKEKELDVAKKEMDFQKQKVDQTKKFAVPNITKDLQRLKGAKI